MMVSRRGTVGGLVEGEGWGVSEGGGVGGSR